MMRWLILVISAFVIGGASALAFGRLRPQTHDIGALFGDALVGLVVLVMVMVVGWFKFIR
jgi:hypothetical protein